MKPLHVCLIVLQYYAIVATGRAGYVLYRALVGKVTDGAEDAAESATHIKIFMCHGSRNLHQIRVSISSFLRPWYVCSWCVTCVHVGINGTVL